MNIINFEPQSCKKAREYLDAYLDNELLIETSHEVAKHLQDCQGCSEALEARARVKAALKNAVSKDAAPDALQERIRARIRKDGPETGFHWNRFLYAAAAALVVLAATWGVLQLRDSRKPPADTLQALAGPDAQVFKVGLSNHVHCAIDRGWAGRQFTPEQTAEKLGPQFAGLASLIQAQMPAEYRVAIGHRCRFEGREFIHLILKNGDRVASVAVTRKNGETFSSATLSKVMEAAGTPLYQAREGELDIAGFETRDYLAFVVSNLSKTDNLMVAAKLAPSVRDFLARLES